MKSSIFFTLFLIFSHAVNAQKNWSLQDCFDHALQNNINIKQIELSEELATNDFKQSKYNMYLPNISANISESFNFGNSIDPTTYQFVNSATDATRFSLNASYNIFEGLSKLNAIKASKDKLAATEFEIEELKDNTKIAITNLYLQIVIANEVLGIAKENLNLTQNQYKNTKALVDAGILARGSLLDIDAQLAQNEFNVINAENGLEKTMNQLKLLLQLDPYSDFRIQQINMDSEVEFLDEDPQSVAQNAIAVLPSIKGATFRMNAAQNDLKTAKGSLWPTLSVSAFVGTNYFSAAQEISSYTTVQNPLILTDNNTGNIFSTSIPSQSPNFKNTSFGKQLENNLTENISLNLSIPILASWQRRTAIANAKLNVIKTELDIDSKKQQLNEDVFNAYTDLRMAFKKYKATERNITASNEAYSYANEKYKAGMLNALEFETARNRKIAAQADQVQAKYEYFFRKVILNYYKTGELAF